MDGVTPRPLAYADRLDARETGAIRLVVIHATELPDLATAREYGERIHYPDSQTGNSGHFYIDRDGAIEQWVALDRVAHHVRGHNAASVGIELVNGGRFPHWYRADHQAWREDYPAAQIEALADLLVRLRRALPALVFVTGHDRLDRDMRVAEDNPALMIRRKLDPGPRFPWTRVLAAVDLEFIEAPERLDD